MKTIEDRIIEFKVQHYRETEAAARKQVAYLAERGHVEDYAKRFGLLTVAERLARAETPYSGGYWTRR